MDKTEEVRELQEELTNLRRMLEEPGFKRFQDDINLQLQERLSRIILVAPKGLDDMIEKCYAIGECAGLKLASGLPAIRKEVLEMDIKKLLRNIEGEG